MRIQVPSEPNILGTYAYAALKPDIEPMQVSRVAARTFPEEHIGYLIQGHCPLSASSSGWRSHPVKGNISLASFPILGLDGTIVMKAAHKHYDLSLGVI